MESFVKHSCTWDRLCVFDLKHNYEYYEYLSVTFTSHHLLDTMIRMFRFLEVFLASFAVATTEPTCLRFHYEEQTLRKTITVEMLVEKFKIDLGKTLDLVNDVLMEIKTKRTVSKNE